MKIDLPGCEYAMMAASSGVRTLQRVGALASDLTVRLWAAHFGSGHSFGWRGDLLHSIGKALGIEYYALLTAVYYETIYDPFLNLTQ
eukprot:2223992-Lingulodinium_polyedra.AAC.1